MKLPISIDADSRIPIYHQIEEQLKALIVSGHIPPGTALPSIRALAKELACSVITTRRAYQNLEQQGFIQTTQGKGTFVRPLDESLKKRAKIETVYDSFRKAVEVGRMHDYSDEELKRIFHEVLSEWRETR